MRIFPKLKIKHKLMLVLLIPALFLLAVAVNFMREDYSNVQNLHLSRERGYLSDDIGKVIIALAEERSLSIITFYSETKPDMERLDLAKKHTDAAIHKLRDQIEQSEEILGKQALRQIFPHQLDLLENLSKERERIANKDLTKKEIFSFYNHLETFLFNALTTLANHEEKGSYARSLFSKILILKRIDTETEEQALLYQIFQNNKISPEEYLNLIAIHEKKMNINNIFQNIANEEEIELYEDHITHLHTDQSQKISDHIQTPEIKENFNVDPEAWLKVQEQDISTLDYINRSITNNYFNSMQTSENEARKSLYIFGILFLLAILFSYFITLISFHFLTKNVKNEVNSLTGSGKGIIDAILDISSSASETASAIMETTTTIEELKQTAGVTTEKAHNVTDVSADALKVLRDSQGALDSTIEGMLHIKQGMETISSTIVRLSEHGQAIGEIIGTVNDLAEQSHLLAVNAAIEAAKAGDQGKGFAVVAQEMRSLAEQSKQATIQVRNILQDIQNGTRAAVMATEQGSKAVEDGMSLSIKTTAFINSIYQGIEKVVEAATQIAISNQQQLQGIEQVTIAMTSIKDSTSKQASQMKKIESDMDNLTHVGTNLNQMVEEYTILS